MRRVLLFVYLFLLATITVTPARAALRGSWHARMASDHSLHLNLVREHSENGHTFELSEFTGLSAGQLTGSGNTPVKFTLARDAGTIALEGIFGDGEGGGRFTFTPNAGYAAELHALGVTSTKDLDDEHLFMLASLDVSRQFIRDMQSLGYRVSLEDYTRFRIHGATPEFVREMQSLGYRNLSAEDLVRFRIHGVRADYVREMRDLGYTPSAEDLVRFRIHSVSPDLVKALKTEGYRDISADDLVTFRIHGVSSEFIHALHDYGYKPSAEELVRFRIHGVSSDYLHSLKELGYTPTAGQLVEMRIHAVTPEFIRSLKEAGYSAIPVEKLIEMRIHGIDARYLKAVK